MYVFSTGIFSKTGGIIYGDDDNDPDNGDVKDNTTTQGNTNGHAVFYYGSGNRYRDTTLNTGDNISTSDTTENWNR